MKAHGHVWNFCHLKPTGSRSQSYKMDGIDCLFISPIKKQCSAIIPKDRDALPSCNCGCSTWSRFQQKAPVWLEAQSTKEKRAIEQFQHNSYCYVKERKVCEIKRASSIKVWHPVLWTFHYK